MSFRLPTADHAARPFLADMAHVAEVLNPANLERMEHFSDALRRLRRDYPAGVKSVAVIVFRADDERWLISVGPRGGWRKLWNFGTGRD